MTSHVTEVVDSVLKIMLIGDYSTCLLHAALFKTVANGNWAFSKPPTTARRTHPHVARPPCQPMPVGVCVCLLGLHSRGA
jgi:hypothetical protein